MESAISINLSKNNSLLVPDDSFASSSSILVKLSDSVSTIFDAIGSLSRQDKLIFNGQILCPALSFAFYNIHNNDTISIASPPMPASTSYTDLSSNAPLKDYSSNHQVIVAAPRPLQISRKRTLFHSNSSNLFKNIPGNSSDNVQRILNEKCNRRRSNQQFQSDSSSIESARLTDIYKTRVESNTKSFRKLCTKYSTLPDPIASGRVPSQTPPPSLVARPGIEYINELRQETILPGKAELPSTDFLPEFKFYS
ncbi:hypothetical protein M9Y10_003878 [Tritrichomonas musculus]|uniref:Ubiquitin-like domain-containing protein n=1 Tax=Tritrichomonas musculus TaxID=1915356 RepID=A0ABR2JRS5_9EUKA